MQRKLGALLLSLLFVALAPNLAEAQPAQPAKPKTLKASIAAIEGRLAKLEASGETNTLAIAQISTKLAELTQRVDALASAQTSGPDLVNRVDDVSLKTAALEREVETLRTQLADLEQPYAAETGGSASGFTLSSGNFSATLSAYLHARWQFLTPEDFATITESTFRLRRARVGLKGKGGTIFDMPITYEFLADFTGAPSLRDFIVDLEIRPEISLMLGQTKIRHVRSFINSSKKLLFHERSTSSSSYRYDRDIGLWAHGKLLGGKLGYHAGVSNGGGPNARNDNIDFAVSARVFGAALGDLLSTTEGDFANTEKPAITVGASIVHDLVRLPEFIGGLVVMERDVDSDEIIDNVRVLSLSADATFRLKGFELGGEAYMRRESWGTILDHSNNEELRDLIAPSSDGNRTYLGGTGRASYFVWPKTVAVGARLGYSQQTYLGLGGQNGRRPPADRLFELDLIGQLYRANGRLLGAQYTLTNYNASVGDDPAFDIEHRFILETQLLF